MLELPSGSQTGVLQRHTGVSRRHIWAASTALVSFNRNVATLLLLAVAVMVTPHEARLEPRQYPLGCRLEGVPHQRHCSHAWDAGAHTMLRLGQLKGWNPMFLRTLTPHEAHLEPRQTPHESTLVETPHQRQCDHGWDADAHTMMRLGQLHTGL
jgi:hypothetical protein